MGLIASDSGGGEFELCPQGTQMARCIQVIDLGTQHNAKFDKWNHKVLIGWELPNTARDDDGSPFLVWNEYTVSLHEKSNLRKDLQSWRGKPFTQEELEGFDLSALIGVPCMINVVHNENGDRTYANVSALVSVPDGVDVPEQVNDPIYFEIEEWNQSVFETFSDNLKDKINRSKEGQARNAPADQNANQEPTTPRDNIPF